MSDLERLWRAIKAFLLTLWSLLRQLFHEVTGLLFLILAVVGVIASVREWIVYGHSTAPDLLRPIVATGFALLMLWFGVTSLARARRINRDRTNAR